ncbi:protein-disulfide reductase DsbD domain-containing protein [Oleiagrimonas sp. MCCC 1A03011]|uniref:protein-disulfide reductase DsbD domain-containing protein n=1 Tax=Oleiagrimonas sp. MCCC 1A03011 TaxID=1926883 RepID=UPI000DC2BFE2|nr:protein-disulfide reductase DsbD domain-containing protein [Oleiagrimonas sp. MCCC 1A03011]RAP56092.1 hypothetical protein BTJ49_14725 [Oleiagrimonas sp. MCCC 1A03011]
MATSADKVRIRAHFEGPPAADGSRAIAVRLLIAPGWHVNANPASFESLIPTTLRTRVAGKPVRLEVRYPLGRTSAIRLQGKPLKVYENGTVLTARMPAPKLIAARADDELVLDVAVQSCSDQGTCLPPAELTTRLRPASCGFASPDVKKAPPHCPIGCSRTCTQAGRCDQPDPSAPLRIDDAHDARHHQQSTLRGHTGNR